MGKTRVAIIEIGIGGVLGYHAECLGCPWKSKPFNHEASAVRVAKAHRCLEGMRNRTMSDNRLVTGEDA